MNKTVEPPSTDDVERLAAKITDIAERSQRLVTEFIEKTTDPSASPEEAQGAMQDRLCHWADIHGIRRADGR